jgi:small subunit ribosomal protein S16
VLEKERAAKTGNIVEKLGTYNPRSKELTLNEEAVKGWISKGAQLTDSIHNLFVAKGIIEGKKKNVVSQRALEKKEEPETAPAPMSEIGVPTESVGKAGAPAESGREEAPPETSPAVEVAAPSEAEVVEEAIPEEAPAVSAEAFAAKEEPSTT